MDSVITRVLNNPRSKTTWLCMPTGMKPFVISKSKFIGMKPQPNKFYIVNLETSPYANGSKAYVKKVTCLAELQVKTATKRKKSK
jgi:hypothetical protein